MGWARHTTRATRVRFIQRRLVDSRVRSIRRGGRTAVSEPLAAVRPQPSTDLAANLAAHDGAAETARHPVDALRANVRGLAADLTLASVGVGRTAARWLQKAAAAPVGRRAVELADAWTGGAAREWTAR